MLRALPALLVLACSAPLLGGNAATAAAAQTCGSGAYGPSGYAYAGVEARTATHGVRATILPLRAVSASTGHVGAWVGVGSWGGAWLQAGIAALPGEPMELYAESSTGSATPRYFDLGREVAVGEAHRFAVLEVRGSPGWWRVWLDGAAVTQPIRLAGARQTVATAESLRSSSGPCNAFSFRFSSVGVAAAAGGSWQRLTPGRRLVDDGYRVRTLAGTAYAFDSSSP